MAGTLSAAMAILGNNSRGLGVGKLRRLACGESVNPTDAREAGDQPATNCCSVDSGNCDDGESAGASEGDEASGQLQGGNDDE
jgi:hypothetical protein